MQGENHCLPLVYAQQRDTSPSRVAWSTQWSVMAVSAFLMVTCCLIRQQRVAEVSFSYTLRGSKDSAQPYDPAAVGNRCDRPPSSAELACKGAPG